MAKITELAQEACRARNRARESTATHTPPCLPTPNDAMRSTPPVAAIYTLAEVAQAVEVCRLLDSQGWAVVCAGNLPGRPLVLWALDGKVKAPDTLAGLVRFTLAELQHVHGANLASVYQVKAVFGGAEVVPPGTEEA